jgi:hypothetical protein
MIFHIHQSKLSEEVFQGSTQLRMRQIASRFDIHIIDWVFPKPQMWTSAELYTQINVRGIVNPTPLVHPITMNILEFRDMELV